MNMIKQSLLAAAVCAKMVLAAYAFSAPPASATDPDSDAGYLPNPPCAPGESCWDES
jgi:hypothetical protein